MLPQFPKFKSIELTDKEEVEKITHKYPPYSDFNFVSMWSWDIKGEMRISQLNGNLVVRFTDYLTGEPFYSFLGNNKVNETAEKLLELSKKEGIKPVLKLVPEDSVKGLDDKKFKVKEDRDNFDYIFDLKVISEYKGNRFFKKRNRVNIFLKKFPNFLMEILDFKSLSTQKEILRLDEEWLRNKIKKDVNFKIKNEFLATERFFKSKNGDIIMTGIFNNKRLIGYSIFQILSNGYSISHFGKADINFTGIYDYLTRESAKILLNEKCLFLNYEQDLGISGLRNSKKSFMSRFLRKSTVSFVN